MKRAKDITFIIGPPGPIEEKKRLEELSRRAGKPASEIWVEYVHEVLGQLSNREMNQAESDLDDLISRAVQTPVRVTDPFPTYTFHGGGRVPGLILYMEKITSPDGRPARLDWTTPSIREAIGSALGLVFKAEWVRTIVSYG